MSDITLAAHRPLTVPLQQAAEDLGLSQAAVRRAIQADTEERLPDDIRRIPGGRLEGASYYVIRKQYERILGSQSVAEVSPIHRRTKA